MPFALQVPLRDRAALRDAVSAPARHDVHLRVSDRRASSSRSRRPRSRSSRPCRSRARRSTPERVARHVVATSWISLALVAPRPASSPSSARRSSSACSGRATPAAPAPSSAGSSSPRARGWSPRSRVTVAFPLLFVQGRARWLPLLAVARAPRPRARRWVLQRAFGLTGVAVGAGASRPRSCSPCCSRALARVAADACGLVAAAVVCGGARRRSRTGCPRLVLGAGAAAAVVGLAVYAACSRPGAPAGLRDAWRYVRALQ